MPPKRNPVERRIQRLENMFSQMTLRGAPSGRRAAGRRRRRPSNQPSAAPRIGQVTPGEVVITKLELCTTIKVEASKPSASGKCSLQVADFPFLKVLSASFERIRWHSCKVMYKPAASMVTAGLVTMGVDWSWSNLATDRKKIAAYTPTATAAVWKEFTMILPPNRLQSRIWYNTRESDTIDSGPGQICFAVDAPGGSSGLTAGELWIEYRVTLSGTSF